MGARLYERDARPVGTPMDALREMVETAQCSWATLIACDPVTRQKLAILTLSYPRSPPLVGPDARPDIHHCQVSSCSSAKIRVPRSCCQVNVQSALPPSSSMQAATDILEKRAKLNSGRPHNHFEVDIVEKRMVLANIDEPDA